MLVWTGITRELKVLPERPKLVRTLAVLSGVAVLERLSSVRRPVGEWARGSLRRRRCYLFFAEFGLFFVSLSLASASSLSLL